MALICSTTSSSTQIPQCRHPLDRRMRSLAVLFPWPFKQ